MALGHLNTRAPGLFVAPHSKFQEQRTGDVAFGLHVGRNILQALKVKKSKTQPSGNVAQLCLSVPVCRRITQGLWSW